LRHRFFTNGQSREQSIDESAQSDSSLRGFGEPGVLDAQAISWLGTRKSTQGKVLFRIGTERGVG
jgi:hypothetical protein